MLGAKDVGLVGRRNMGSIDMLVARRWEGEEIDRFMAGWMALSRISGLAHYS